MLQHFLNVFFVWQMQEMSFLIQRHNGRWPNCKATGMKHFVHLKDEMHTDIFAWLTVIASQNFKITKREEKLRNVVVIKIV